MKMLLAVSLSSLVMSAYAQMGPGPGAEPEMPGCPGMEACEHMGPHHMKGPMGERMAQHAKVLHDKLKLSTDQEAAWKELEAAWKPPADQKRLDMAELEKLTAPERMEKMLGRMKQHEASMGVRLAAIKTFYAKLTPEQQKTFDRETLAPWKQMSERRKARHGAKPAAK